MQFLCDRNAVGIHSSNPPLLGAYVKPLCYYETVAGGAGAGEGWDGGSAAHTHMTNSRITDPEILGNVVFLRVEDMTGWDPNLYRLCMIVAFLLGAIFIPNVATLITISGYAARFRAE